MYVYVASSPLLSARGIFKIGSTANPVGRLATYLTGTPPGQTPSHDIEFLGLWRTNACTRDELYDHEEHMHEHFSNYRLMRAIPGDSEWFDFKTEKSEDALSEMRAFVMAQEWFCEEVLASDVAPLPSAPSRYLRKRCPANLRFIRDPNERLRRLEELQAPVISNIAEFCRDAEREAGYVIAPCGSGKTVMASKAFHLAELSRVIVCCPSRQIQAQWQETLTQCGAFAESEILLVGQAGTTSPEEINCALARERFCVVTTYMSSHLLTPLISAADARIAPQVLALDEAHHMSGPVSQDDGTGEGRTRTLVQRARELRIKRLSLTYTPRFIATVAKQSRSLFSLDNSEISPSENTTILSMDDQDAFGKQIAEMHIRTLIDDGILPDYRVWTLRDVENNGTGISGKAECLIEAWAAREVSRGVERHVLHHLVVFCATTDEARLMETLLRDRLSTDGTLVLRVEQGQNVAAALAQFDAAERAIIVNCFVLNEGVNIPRANAVAITYPKQSRGQITQMVLRAGRWRSDKPVFHVLLPVLGSEDLTGFEEVLAALATHDARIRDEIVYHCLPREAFEEMRRRSLCGDAARDRFFGAALDVGAAATCVMIDESPAVLEEIRRCFANVRANFFPAHESARIRALCAEKGVTTSVEYALLREEIPELSEDPRINGMTWFAFLNPGKECALDATTFENKILKENGITRSRDYDQWHGVQPSDVRANLPSVQNINDGYFGSDVFSISLFLRKDANRQDSGRRKLRGAEAQSDRCSTNEE